MKKIIILILVFLVQNLSVSQIKQRAASTNVYTGIGYKFVFLTDPDANDAYPFFQLSSGDFLKEIDGFIGVTLNETYGIEFCPAYLFTNTVNSDGYYFNFENNRRFYVPAQSRLVAVPLNLRFKYYPFGKDYTSTLSKVYFGIGAGMMYVNEEIVGDVYLADDELIRYSSFKAEDSDWVANYEFLLGINSFSKIGFGFELSYRLVPLDNLENKPIITATADNFNSINLAANIIFSF